MRKLLGYAGIVVAALLVAYYLLPTKLATLGSSTTYSSLNVQPLTSTGDSYAYAVNDTSIINTSGVYVGTISSTAIALSSLTIGGGTAITGYKCATSSWNPAAAGSSTAINTDITLTGVVMGDTVAVSLTTSTQGLLLKGNASTSDVVNVILSDPDNSGAAIDIGTSTLKACYTH